MDVTYAFSQTTDNFDSKLGPNRGWQLIHVIEDRLLSNSQKDLV